MAEGAIPVASLAPRLWLYPLDAAEERVLVRLKSNTAEEFEYAVEAVEALDGCRFVEAAYSYVCVCRRG